MKIEQLLLQEHGQKIGGMTLTTKTCKKSWQTGEVWWHQVVFMDETGEIPADVKIVNYLPLKSGQKVKIIVAEVRDAEYLGKPRTILVVDQFKVETQMIDDYYAEADKNYAIEMAEVRGKIRHGIVCSMISRSHSGPITLKFTKEQKNEVAELVEFIMTGE